ncbi:MAG TPA: RloB family protein [Actinocrinis sp.]|nr:RloB family protein [Actinocrinis sp.]
MKGKNKSLARKPGNATAAPTIAIVCEGAVTECVCFEGIRKDLRLATTRILVTGIGSDPVSVVKAASAKAKDFDQVWAVFDVEAPTPHANLNTALKLAEELGVRCAVSNPCFEFWLLLHFKDWTAYLDNAVVRKKIKAYPGRYSDKDFDFAATWPAHRSAIDRAAKLDARQMTDHPDDVIARNPWTSVHNLVGVLVELHRWRRAGGAVMIVAGP